MLMFSYPFHHNRVSYQTVSLIFSSSTCVFVAPRWVAALDLPRGVLHGMDKDGEPLTVRHNGARFWIIFFSMACVFACCASLEAQVFSNYCFAHVTFWRNGLAPCILDWELIRGDFLCMTTAD